MLNISIEIYQDQSGVSNRQECSIPPVNRRLSKLTAQTRKLNIEILELVDSYLNET